MIFLNEPDTLIYLESHNIKKFSFTQFFKGKSELGSLVESCVKLTKHLIMKSIRKNVLSLKDFEFIIFKVIHLVNKRPIAFKYSLQSLNDQLPEPITPEILLKGYSLPSLNILPLHQDVDDFPCDNESSIDKIRDIRENFQRVRKRLIKIYNEEFLGNLVYQAVNKKDRYKPVDHKLLQVGDLVLIKEEFCKPTNYPMGMVKKVIINNLHEVTAAEILKGNREIVKRHVTTLIPYLTRNSSYEDQGEIINSNSKGISVDSRRPIRTAALDCKRKLKLLTDDVNT